MKKTSLVIAGLVFPLSLAITGCDNKEKKAEQAAQEVEDAAKKVVEGAEKAAEATENKVEEIAKAVENKVEEATKSDAAPAAAPEEEKAKSE